MPGGRTLEERLDTYRARPRPVDRRSFDHVHLRGLRRRIQDQLNAAVLTFELDRVILEIEVEATDRWLANLVEFDAYCARREHRI